MMIIKTVKAGLATNLVWVAFDNDSFLPLFIDDVVLLQLKAGQEVEGDRHQQIVDLSVQYFLKNYALRQVAISPKIESVLRPKLLLRLHQFCHQYKIVIPSPDIYISQVLNYLQEKKLIEPDQFAQYLMSRHRHHSRRYLSQLLHHYGLNPREYPHPIDSDVPKITKILQKKNLSTKDLLDLKTKNKIISALARKGFTVSDVKNVIGDLTKSLLK